MYRLVLLLLLSQNLQPSFARKRCSSSKNHTVKLLPNSQDIPVLPSLPGPTRRIQGGYRVGSNFKQYSYVVRLHLVYKLDVRIDQEAKIPPAKSCTGSIISKFWLISAGHCLYANYKSNKLDRRTGDMDFKRSYVNVGTSYYNDEVPKLRMEYAVVYPQYKTIYVNHTFYEAMHDLMLLKTIDNVIDGRNTMAVPLPMYHDVPPYGVTCEALGWGRTNKRTEVITDNLQIGDQYVITPTDCYDEMFKYVHESSILPDTVICTEHSRVIILDGDSGGPLIFKNKLVGITSVISLHRYAMYTRVAYYVDWIKGVMNGSLGHDFKPHTTPNITIDEAPYMARLNFFKDKKKSFTNHYTCAGAVIATTKILTSAHCMFEGNTFNINFKVRDSYAEVGFDVHDRYVTEHRLIYFRVYPEYNPDTNHGDIAIVATATSLLIKEVRPAIIGKVDDINYGSRARIIVYNSLIEADTPGTYVDDLSGERGRYLQAGLFLVYTTNWCKTAEHDLNDASLMCLNSNNTYQFTGNIAGSPVIQNGVIIGIVSFHYTGQVVAVTATVDIAKWVTWVVVPERDATPLPKSCSDLRDLVIRDSANVLRKAEHMYNLNSIIPVCRGKDEEMDWSSVNFVAKITIIYNTGRYPKTCSGVFIRENIALTAAHVLLYPNTFDYNKEILAVFVSIGADSYESDIAVFKLRQYRVHPDYDPTKMINDVALLYLKWHSGPVDSIEYAQLATPADNITYTRVDFAGWGSHFTHMEGGALDWPVYRILRSISTLATRDLYDCNHFYEGAGRGALSNATSICLESNRLEMNADGDIGAPARINGKVIGIMTIIDYSPITGALLTNLVTLSSWILNAAEKKNTSDVSDCDKILEMLDKDKDNPLKSAEHKWNLKWEIPVCAETPYLAKISLLSTKAQNFHTCTGAIISERWVIGRAFCAIGPFRAPVLLDLSYMQVGQIDFTKHKIWRIITHEDYSIYDNLHDLALYESETSLDTISSFTRVIQITPDGDNYRLKPGKVYGWEQLTKPGNPNSQQVVYQELIISKGNFSDCESTHLGGENICMLMYYAPKYDNSEKLFNRNFGPVIYKNTLLGMLSWHLSSGWTVLATNLTYYREWIEDTLERPLHKELNVFEPPKQKYDGPINVTLEEAPYMARINLYAERHNKNKYNKLCVGSILSETLILTAASCLYEENIKTIQFKVEESFAEFGFEVYNQKDPNLIECNLLYFRINAEFNKDNLTSNIAVFRTKGCNILDLNPDLQIIPVAAQKLDNSLIGKIVSVVSYSNLIQKNDGQIVNGGNSGLHHTYLQRVFFTIQPTSWCSSPAHQIVHLNESVFLCLVHNKTFSFGTEGSVVLLDGNLIGIVNFEVGNRKEPAPVATSLNENLVKWLDWLHYHNVSRQQFPYNVNCTSLRSLMTYTYVAKQQLKYLDQMWDLQWVIPLCSDEIVNFHWNDATNIAKITRVRPDGYKQVCTGSFLRKDLVVTSASCIYGAIVPLILVSTGFNGQESDIVRFKIKEVAIHPEFEQNATLVADLALLILKMPVLPTPLYDHITTVSLGDGSDVSNNENVEVWGWGEFDNDYHFYNILHKNQFTVAPVANCHHINSKYDHQINDTFTYCIMNTQITNDEKPISVRNTAKGDSGGPVLKNKNTLVGISSLNDRGITGWTMTVTRISKYYSWLDSYINNKPRIRNLPCNEIRDILERDKYNTLKMLDHQRDLNYGIPDCGKATFIAKISLMKSVTGQLFKVCIGAIIRERWVLGSAHCSYVFPETTVDVRRSYLQVGQRVKTSFFLKEIIRHQHYNPTTRDHDIALYHTVSDLIGGHTGASKLSVTPKSVLAFGKNVQVYGWEAQANEITNPLQVVVNDVKVVYTSMCRFDAEYAHLVRDKTFNIETNFCVHNQTQYMYTEYQGPVAYDNTLLGMVSWGHSPVIMTNVTAYEDFIDNVVQKNPDDD